MIAQVKWFDFRHYKRQKSGPGAKAQLPTAYGHLSNLALAYLLQDRYLDLKEPALLLCSPQGRARLMAGNLMEARRWSQVQPEEMAELDDFGSQPEGVALKDAVLAFAADNAVSVEHAVVMGPGRDYMLRRSLAAINIVVGKVLPMVVADVVQPIQVVTSTHGGAVEMRAIMMSLMQAQTKGANPAALMSDACKLGLVGGVVDTCEGFVYEFSVGTELQAISRVHSVQRFELPPEVKALERVLDRE